MPPPQAAIDHYKTQQQAAAQTVAATQRLWARVSAANLDSSWSSVLSALLAAVISGQVLAVSEVDAYIDDVLAEQALPSSPVGPLAVAAFAGVAGDGWPLGDMLFGAVTWVKQLIGAGRAPAQALESGGSRLAMLASTAVQDAGRAAEQVAIAARPSVAGYVRMLNPPACSRCAILAGRWYRWDAGFDRHPRCDCRSIPAAESVADDLTTDPRSYFDSLDEAQQNRIFTSAGAEAIRLGADLGQVVNARRGMQTATAYGRKVRSTTEGTSKRGSFGAAERARVAAITGEDPRSVRLSTPRLMPETIFELADGDRAGATRLLQRFGYLA